MVALQVYMLMKFYAVVTRYSRDQKEATAVVNRSKQIRRNAKKSKGKDLFDCIHSRLSYY